MVDDDDDDDDDDSFVVDIRRCPHRRVDVEIVEMVEIVVVPTRIVRSPSVVAHDCRHSFISRITSHHRSVAARPRPTHVLPRSREY